MLPIRSIFDRLSDDTTRGAIWMRDSGRNLDFDEVDEYNMYAPAAPKKGFQRNSWNIFEMG
jgi:hypothetical protein